MWPMTSNYSIVTLPTKITKFELHDRMTLTSDHLTFKACHVRSVKCMFLTTIKQLKKLTYQKAIKNKKKTQMTGTICGPSYNFKISFIHWHSVAV